MEQTSLKKVSNPPNPYHPTVIEWLDAPPEAHLEIYEERAKSIIAKNDSPDLGFEYSINPYRGCFHACAYCYARPSHQYLDFGAGTDFERKIVVKTNAPELLREAFMKPSWKGGLIVFSGNTDCYQPLEVSYELTRRCLQVCNEFKNPVSIITKGALIRRDLELLSDLNHRADLHVTMSIAFSDDDMARAIEPNAPRPSTRFRALSELSNAGISTSVSLAPIIPGLNDHQIPEVLKRAKECGAESAFFALLRLPLQVKDVFFTRLEESYPNRVKKVRTFLQSMKGGVLNRSDFGKRMVGEGPQWEAINWLFKDSCERLGLNKRRHRKEETPPTFSRPSAQLQFPF